MKNKVKLDAMSMALTVVVILALGGAAVAVREEGNNGYIVVGILVLLVVAGLFYWPLSLEATAEALVVSRPVAKKMIPYTSIAEVKRCYPSAGGLRLLGSGGFLGYWGYFSDTVIGNYFGYYGDRSQCILVKLTSGKQYVVSCQAPDEMVEAIRGHL